MFKHYQAVVKKVMADLSEDELEKAQVAHKKGPVYMEHFSNEMWRQCGMRVFVLSAWKNEHGEVLFGMHDDNKALGDGDSFMKTKDWEDIELVWQEYAQEQFGGEARDGGQQVKGGQKRMKKPVFNLEMDGDGMPLLPDITETKLEEKKAIVRVFLTKHYRICSGIDKAVVLSGGCKLEGAFQVAKLGYHCLAQFLAQRNKEGDMVDSVVSEKSPPHLKRKRVMIWRPWDSSTESESEAEGPGNVEHEVPKMQLRHRREQLGIYTSFSSFNMSTAAETSFAELKAITRQIVDIVCMAQLLPPGNSHLALKAQVTEQVAKAVRDHEDAPCILGIVLSCSKELLCIRQVSPQDSPDWHSISHNDCCLQRHSWRHKVSAWEALGDQTFDLPVDAPKSPDTVVVDLPSPPVIAGSIASPLFSTINESREKHKDKGKGNVLDADLEHEVDGSRKRKSPLISGPFSQPPKSAMKSRKRAKSARVVKSAEFVESEDEHVDKPAAQGGPVILVHSLTSVSPQIPKKRPFGPVNVIARRHADVAGQTDSTSNTPMVTPVVAPTVINGPAGSPLEVVEHSDLVSNTPAVTPDVAPTVINTDDILIPGPMKQPMLGLQQCGVALHDPVRQEDWERPSLLSPPKRSWGKSTTRKARSQTPSKGPSTSQPKARACSQSRGVAGATSAGATRTASGSAATMPKTHGCSKTITAVKAPAPPPTPSPAPAHACVPRGALDVPMPDLHSMAMTICDSAGRINALKDLVAEQGRRINTLTRLHESLQCGTMEPHPSFPLPTTPAIATSLLLDQSVAGTTSPSQSALPPLINLSMAVYDTVMEPTPSKIEDPSAIKGLSFEPSQVQPALDPSPTPPTAGAILVLDDPHNLVPEYNSADEMDVEVKVEVEGGDEGHLGEVDMST
ncbi:uncharacterized protein EDB91DRAFT_1253836 [Suillus paluster]|uniref:uncharacterized protein n=1 Tax=Suillus paluster TaxID=48578 RepID=UPI001B85F499|nr:uncharacterized protein EDB91DRAFT_1253836 [Suillus paluster]KAG1727575.1 hypothetical protein EDB91DRAFT_1253836 [Suillus paluster]